MDVFEAIDSIRAAGELIVEGNTIRTRIPRNRMPELQIALQLIRERKATAIELLSSQDKAAAASLFINRAGARLVCPHCWPDCQIGARYALLVPQANDDAEFRGAVRILGMQDMPVFPRTEPLMLMRCSALE
jgi:hypothetical protein